MKIENLKLGDIIVYELDEFMGNDNKRVTVVGSKPIIRDGVISFHPILKKNKNCELGQKFNFANINSIADYTIIGDAFEIIPKLIKYYKANTK